MGFCIARGPAGAAEIRGCGKPGIEGLLFWCGNFLLLHNSNNILRDQKAEI